MPRPPINRLMQKDKNAPKITKGRALKNTFWMYARIRKYVPWLIFMVVFNGVVSGINGAVEMLYVKALYDFIGKKRFVRNNASSYRSVHPLSYDLVFFQHLVLAGLLDHCAGKTAYCAT